MKGECENGKEKRVRKIKSGKRADEFNKLM